MSFFNIERDSSLELGMTWNEESHSSETKRRMCKKGK
jgi:hypothetical protein